MIDTYKTIAEESMGEYKDKGSKFIAYALPFNEKTTPSVYDKTIENDKSKGNETAFTVFLDRIKKEHPKARHYCYAWRIGTDGNRFRANDDGEPSGTAGRPILGQIDSFGLTNVAIIVVRYFGGTLLGTSGLIHAYRESAAQALKNAQIIEKIVEDFFDIYFSYDKMPDVMTAIKKINAPIIEQHFEIDATLKIAIRKRDSQKNLLLFWSYALRKSIEEIESMKQPIGELEGIKVVQI